MKRVDLVVVCRRSARYLAIVAATLCLALGAAQAETVVALGASNTYGKGVARSEAYPAQLEKILRAKSLSVHVINAGVNGEKTASMLSRLDRVVPKGTKVVILQPGGNDRRKGGTDVTGEIRSRLAARGIKVVMIENSMLRGLPLQPDHQHPTAEGYRMLAQSVASQVAGALGH